MGISLLSLWLTLLWYPWPCSLKTKMFKSKSNLKHFINLLHFFLKNYFFCRKSISEPADGPWLKSIFFYSNGFLFWLRKKIMEHLSVLADIYSSLFCCVILCYYYYYSSRRASNNIQTSILVYYQYSI